MTRPGGPEEPPGPRFVSRQLVEDVLTGLITAGEAARRIDAALAEQAARIERLDVQLAGCSTAAMGYIAEPATPEQYGWSRAYQDVLELRRKWDAGEKALAEREAQCAALREAGLAVCEHDCPHHLGETMCNRCFDLQLDLEDQLKKVIGDTADAARAFVERAKAEGAEEMRELIARLVDAKQEAWDRKGEQHPAETCSKIAAAIRALK